MDFKICANFYITGPPTHIKRARNDHDVNDHATCPIVYRQKIRNLKKCTITETTKPPTRPVCVLTSTVNCFSRFSWEKTSQSKSQIIDPSPFMNEHKILSSVNLSTKFCPRSTWVQNFVLRQREDNSEDKFCTQVHWGQNFVLRQREDNCEDKILYSLMEIKFSRLIF